MLTSNATVVSVTQAGDKTADDADQADWSAWSTSFGTMGSREGAVRTGGGGRRETLEQREARVRELSSTER